MSRSEVFLRDILRGNYPFNFWPNSLLALSLVTSYSAFGDPKDLIVLEEFCNKIIDEAGNIRSELISVEHCMIGYTFLELSELTQNRRYLTASDTIAEFLLHKYKKSQTGTLPYRARGSRLTMLVDTLAMICPFLARYGTRLSCSEATDLAVKQMDEFIQRGLDKQTLLPFHGYAEQQPGGLGIVGWTRGAGWFAIGLVDTLAHLNKNHQNFEKFAQQLRTFSNAVRDYQREDGCWGWATTIPDAPIDTSGTAMIGYSIERGVDIGVLDQSFLDISTNAINGIISATSRRGVVGHALVDCNGVGLYSKCFRPAKWAQGPSTALSALVLKRERAKRS